MARLTCQAENVKEAFGKRGRLPFVASHELPAAETVVEWSVVDWRRFTPENFEYDFERDKLFEHQVTFEEAVECFFSDFEVRRNKKFRDRYQLIGRTLGGRKLKVIFQVKPGSIIRIITGWPL